MPQTRRSAHRCGLIHDPGTPCADGRTLPTLANLLTRDTMRDAPAALRVSAPGRNALPNMREALTGGAWSPTVRLVIASERHCDDGHALSVTGADASSYSGEVYWAHDPTHLIGRCLAVYDERDLLIGEVQFDLDTECGRDTYRRHLDGQTVDASVGYEITAERAGYATAWKLCDISIVPPGAGLDPMAVTPAWRL